jgi:hypothetical protein
MYYLLVIIGSLLSYGIGLYEAWFNQAWEQGTFYVLLAHVAISWNDRARRANRS